jgi:cell division protein FtsI/penicillin-binding protein 2
MDENLWYYKLYTQKIEYTNENKVQNVSLLFCLFWILILVIELYIFMVQVCEQGYHVSRSTVIS